MLPTEDRGLVDPGDHPARPDMKKPAEEVVRPSAGWSVRIAPGAVSGRLDPCFEWFHSRFAPEDADGPGGARPSDRALLCIC